MNNNGCVNASEILPKDRTLVTLIYHRASFVILIAGIVGNLLAITVLLSHKNVRKSTDGPVKVNTCNKVNNYILTMFHIMSLVSVLCLIIIPIMVYYGNTNKYGMWITRSWAVYSGDAHYPIANSLVSFTYLLYFIYFSNQVIAVAYPFKYKSLVTHRNINAIMVATAVYCVIWYVPTFKWLEVEALQVCPEPPDPKVTTEGDRQNPNREEVVIYRTRNWSPTSIRQWRAWMAYEVFRELLVNILPFVSMIVFKLFVMIKRERIRGKVVPSSTPQASDASHLIANVSKNSLQSGDCPNARHSTGPDLPSKTSTPFYVVDRSQLSSVSIDMGNSNLKTTMDSRYLSNNQSNPRTQRSSAAIQHKRTLLILTCEFVIFMLPYNIFEICNNTRPLLNPVAQNDVFQIFSMMRFINLAFSFYINYCLNPLYRKKVDAILSKYWTQYFK